MRILFVHKENKNNDIQQFVSSLSLCASVAPFWRAYDGRKVRTLFSVISNEWIRCFRSNQSVNKHTIRIHALLMTENSIRALRPLDALQNGATFTYELLNFSTLILPSRLRCEQMPVRKDWGLF